MKSILKFFVVRIVHVFATVRGFSFPKDFLWYWQLDYLLERYEPETTAFFKRTIRPGMVCIDIGANFGYYTRLMARLAGPTGKVIAVEADAENFAYLSKNTERYQNIVAVQAAISDHTGMTDFYHLTGTSSSGVHSTLPASGAERRQVESFTLDDLVIRYADGKADFIKIDVEGAEPQVFSGAVEALSKKPIVVFEYTPETSKALIEELKASHTLYALTSDGNRAPLSSLTLMHGKRDFANLVLDDRELQRTGM